LESINKKVKLARSGDKIALVELVQLRKDYLYRIAWSYLQSEHDVYDALQETIIKAFYDIVNLKKPEYFYTWYTRVLINTCKQILQQGKKLVNIEDIRESICTRENSDESKMDIERGLLKLSGEHREVIFMHYMEDLPIKDIALILDLPEGTVKSRIYYGISKLRGFVCERKVQEQ